MALGTLSATALLAFQPGCSGCAKREGDVVGRYSGGIITSVDLQREANRLPPALRTQFETPYGRRELVAAMIDKRLLAQEAEARKLQEDPEIQRQVRELQERLVLQALLAEEERAAGAPTDAEVRSWYEAHKRELAQPERVHVARVLAAVPKNGTAADRARARARVEKLVARARRGEPFERVAAEGDGPEKVRGGDLGLLARGATPDRQLEEAAFRLRGPAELSPPVECADGVAVLRLIERRPARIPSLEESRSDVENRLAPLRKRKVLDDLLARLRAKGKTSVEIAAAQR